MATQTLAVVHVKQQQQPFSAPFGGLACFANTFSLAQHRGTRLLSLPDDVLLLIISFVAVKDILSLRKTSKRLCAITKLRWVWTDALKRHVIARGLPVPSPSPEDYLKASPAAHLEARAVHAAKFHENWYASPRPRARRTLQFRATRAAAPSACAGLPGEGEGEEDGEGRREGRGDAVKQVLFLPGTNGEYVVTVLEDVITCWEVPLDGSGAWRVAEYVSETAIEQVLVNEDPAHEVRLAYVGVEKRHPEVVRVHTLTLDRFRGSFALRSVLRARRSVVTPMHVLCRGFMMLGDPVVLWFLSTDGASLTRIHSEAHPFATNKVLRVKVVDEEHVLIVRQHSMELISSRMWVEDGPTTYKTATVPLPVDDPALEAVVVVPGGKSGGGGWPSEPVTVLVRQCDEGFDTIQQYDLLPNAGTGKDKERGGVGELPCVLPEYCTRTVSVAPSCRGLQVSASGKGFWMETRNMSRRRSVYPARCLVGFDVVGAGTVLEEAERGKLEAWEWDEGGNELHVCEGELYARRCDPGEILWKTYAVVCADLEDSVGRIAVGDRRGTVEIVDYV